MPTLINLKSKAHRTDPTAYLVAADQLDDAGEDGSAVRRDSSPNQQPGPPLATAAATASSAARAAATQPQAQNGAAVNCPARRQGPRSAAQLLPTAESRKRRLRG